MLIPLTLIDEGPRIRIDYGDEEFDKLVHSLEVLGQLQPILVVPHDDPTSAFKFQLVAGGRRFRAHQTLVSEGKEQFSNIIAHVGEVPLEARKIVEMEENLCRKAMGWKEYAEGMLQYHETRTAEYSQKLKKFTDAQCGELLGVTASYVGKVLPVAKLLRKGDAEILAAPTITDAITITIRRRTAKAESQLVKHKKATAKAKEETALVEVAELVASEVAQVKPSEDEPTVILHPISLHRYDLRTQLPPVTRVNHIFSDIPYGIDMANLDVNSEVSAAHDVDDNLELMPLFWKLANDVVDEFGWVGFFFDLEHYGRLRFLAISHGFIPQRWPLICNKGANSNANGAPRQNTTKTYEAFFLARRPKAQLARHVGGSVLSWKWVKDERAQYQHNFSKPRELATELLSMFAKPGDVVYDPFCGEGSLLDAAQAFGCHAVGSDYEQEHLNRVLLRNPNSTQL